MAGDLGFDHSPEAVANETWSRLVFRYALRQLAHITSALQPLGKRGEAFLRIREDSGRLEQIHLTTPAWGPGESSAIGGVPGSGQTSSQDRSLRSSFPMGDKTAEDIHRLITTSTLTYVDKCGHFPWIDQPAAFRAAIDMFLAATVTSR